MMFYAPLKRRASYEKKADSDNFYPYNHYRSAIAEDCNFRCVYCDCHEDSVGGREAMELDHLRPWNKKFGVSAEKLFENLVNEPTNLVHSCGVCNGFKWVHWPTEDPDREYDHEKGWIDPFKECRADFLQVQNDGTIVDKKPPAKYQIKQLRLNRPLLKRLREYQILLAIVEKTHKPKWEATIKNQPNTDHAQTATFALAMLSGFQSFLNVK